MLILGFVTLMTMAYAKEPIERESLHEAESFKVERAVKEKSPGRAFAGAKAKKETPEAVEKEAMPMSEDSEVHYWRFQE